MTSSPPAASLSLTGSRLKAQLDASRRPPHVHNVRRAVSSNITPRKKKKEQERERPKTVAETRSAPPRERSPCRHSPSPEKCAAPTPPPSRANSTTSSVAGGKTTSAKGAGEGQLTGQPSPRSSPRRRTPSKLKLRDSLSPLKKLSPSPSSRSSPVGGYADPRKRDDPRLGARASPPKKTPPKLKLKRSSPMTDLASLGRSPSPKSPAKSTPTRAEHQDDALSFSTRKTRKD